jgi:hypothetical protein
MTLDIIYICIALMSIYYGIKTYLRTKHKIILYWVGILLCSLTMELRWLNSGDYLVDATGIFWVTIDIARAVLMIYISKYTYKLKK